MIISALFIQFQNLEVSDTRADAQRTKARYKNYKWVSPDNIS
jgi:hypothetical protein